jgi:hypothetical protein
MTYAAKTGTLFRFPANAGYLSMDMDPQKTNFNAN